jgi:hypothetical protein
MIISTGLEYSASTWIILLQKNSIKFSYSFVFMWASTSTILSTYCRLPFPVCILNIYHIATLLNVPAPPLAQLFQPEECVPRRLMLNECVTDPRALRIHVHYGSTCITDPRALRIHVRTTGTCSSSSISISYQFDSRCISASSSSLAPQLAIEEYISSHSF